MPYFEVIFDVTGLNVSVDGGEPVVGCIVLRRTVAPDLRTAIDEAAETLQQDSKLRSYFEMSQNLGQRDPTVTAQEATEMSWWQYYFTRAAKGFLFYPKEETSEAIEDDSLLMDTLPNQVALLSCLVGCDSDTSVQLPD